MHTVRRKFRGKTDVWASDRADSIVDEWLKEDAETARELLDLVAQISKDGFSIHEKGVVLRYEWEHVWRIRRKRFRLIGFYHYNKDEFIIIDGYEKKTRKLTKRQRKRVDAVAKVRKDKDWVKDQ